MRNTITIIDFTKQVSDISNLQALPEKIRNEILNVDSISSRGFQELNGYNGRQCIWSAGGYWDGKRSCEQDGLYGRGTGKQRFYVTNFGSNQLQWDGKTLRTTSKILN